MNAQKSEFIFEGMVTEVFRPEGLASGGNEAVLYFHGFPGPDPVNPNPSLASQLGPAAAALGLTLFAPQARGLVRSPGVFSFSRAYEDASACVALADGFERVGVVGYSWGGLLGSRVYAAIPTAKRGPLVLLAPVSQPSPKEALAGMIEAWRRDYGHRLTGYPTDAALCEELLATGARMAPSVSLAGIPGDAITILHGDADEVIPFGHSLLLREQLGLPHENLVPMAGQIHGFPDREALVGAILRALRAHGSGA